MLLRHGKFARLLSTNHRKYQLETRHQKRGFQRERASIGESGPSTSRRGGPSHNQEVPSTPRTSTSLTPSGIVSPPFDLTELGTFAKGSEEVSPNMPLPGSYANGLTISASSLSI